MLIEVGTTLNVEPGSHTVGLICCLTPQRCLIQRTHNRSRASGDWRILEAQVLRKTSRAKTQTMWDLAPFLLRARKLSRGDLLLLRSWTVCFGKTILAENTASKEFGLWPIDVRSVLKLCRLHPQFHWLWLQFHWLLSQVTLASKPID